MSRQLWNARERVPLTENGERVVPAIFDLYISAAVAPDHLIAGLSRDVLNAALSVFQRKQRLTVEIYIQEAFRTHGLETQSHLFNADAIRIHSMSLSRMSHFILVAPFAFQSALFLLQSGTKKGNLTRHVKNNKHDVSSSDSDSSSEFEEEIEEFSLRKKFEPVRSSIIELLAKFQKLVAATYYYPITVIDGQKSIRMFNEKGGQKQLRDLCQQASEYVASLNEVCKLSQEARIHFNKPNLYRLVRLYNHTVPCFGHIRHFGELLFEGAHQPLKRAISKSNYRNPQLSAMNSTLKNYWLSRPGVVTSSIEDPGNSDDEISSELESNAIGVSLEQKDSRKLRTLLKNTFVPPLLRDFKRRIRGLGDIFMHDWTSVPRTELEDLGIALERTVFKTQNRKAFQALQKMFGVETPPVQCMVIFMISCFKVRISDVEEYVQERKIDKSIPRHDILRPVEIVQATVNTIWRTCNDEVVMLVNEGQMNYSKEPQSFDMDQSETLFWHIAGLPLSRNIM